MSHSGIAITIFMKIECHKTYLRVIKSSERLYVYLETETINFELKMLNFFHIYLYFIIYCIIILILNWLYDINRWIWMTDKEGENIMFTDINN